MTAIHVTAHHPFCDDDGWDHPGECVIETEFPADPDDPCGDLIQPRLTIVPVTLREANRFVGQEHRHHPPTVGHKWSHGVVIEPTGYLCGVAISGRPVSRKLDEQGYLEVVRVATDGTPNACSALYAAAARAGKEHGYVRSKIITYTLQSEPGTSLRAAGWVLGSTTAGGSWDRPGRRRTDNAPTEPKNRWHAAKPEATS